MEGGVRKVSSNDRQGRPQKGEWNDGEFESFLAEIQPALETSVGRLGVAGTLSNGSQPIDPARLVLTWPDVDDRIIEELR
jgi:hypothetical protein